MANYGLNRDENDRAPRHPEDLPYKKLQPTLPLQKATQEFTNWELDKMNDLPLERAAMNKRSPVSERIGELNTQCSRLGEMISVLHSKLEFVLTDESPTPSDPATSPEYATRLENDLYAVEERLQGFVRNLEVMATRINL